MKELFKNKKILILALVMLFILIGGTFAYFSIQYNANNKSATITGKAGDIGNTIFTTNISKLYMNIDGRVMNPNKTGVTYYATTDESGEALESNPNYVLATISTTSKNALNCTYNYKITATVKNSITDGSDENITVTIGNVTKTLKEILDAGTDGIIISNNIMNLKNNKNKDIYISSTVTNTNFLQNDLQNNFYTINVEQYKDESGKALTCKLENSLAEKLIASGNLWQSGLEGDGYRFTGSGNATASTSPKNFICFGTTDKDTCTANPSTYMYRIIGVFADENGDNHVKLIKYTQLPSAYAWDEDYETDTDWADSDLSKGLNGSHFLTNTTYSYMQDSTWLSKIVDWKWTAVNTKSYEDQENNPTYWYATGKGTYLSEMNKGTSDDTSCATWEGSAINCLGGSWTTPTAKIGLMYVSDYALSLGEEALSYISDNDYTTLKTGWLHQSNNDTTASEHDWTISRFGSIESAQHAWFIYSVGYAYIDCVDVLFGARAVFYLESEVKGEGVGSITDPIMLKIN